MSRTPDRRLRLGAAVVFAVRTVYAGLVHGPWLLTPLVYVRFTDALAPRMNLPALLAVEGLISLLFVGAYRLRFPDWRAAVGPACGFGALFGVAVYVPQNLINLILLETVQPPLAAAWAGAGIGGCLVSALALWAATSRNGERRSGD